MKMGRFYIHRTLCLGYRDIVVVEGVVIIDKSPRAELLEVSVYRTGHLP